VAFSRCGAFFSATTLLDPAPSPAIASELGTFAATATVPRPEAEIASSNATLALVNNLLRIFRTSTLARGNIPLSAMR
jgi:hypothetical protein